MTKSNQIMPSNSILSNTISVLIFLLPMLRYYDLGSTGLGVETILTIIILYLFALLNLTRQKDKPIAQPELRQSGRWFAAFIFWAIIITAYYELFTDININNAQASYSIMAYAKLLISAAIIYNIIRGRLNFSHVFRIYSFFVNITIALYILQWILYLSGVSINFKIPFLQFNSAFGYLNRFSYFGMNPYPTAMFSERAHLAEFLVPYIAICLYSKTLIPKKRFLKAILTSITVISTVSGNGIIIVMIEWVLCFWFFSSAKKRHRISAIIAGLLLLIAIYSILNSIPAFQVTFDRLFIDRSTSSFGSTKADYRIYRGLELYNKMPLSGKIFGIGYNHMQVFAAKYNIVSKYDNARSGYEFFATNMQILLYFGILGLFLCYKSLAVFFKGKSYVVKGLLIMMAALWFSSQMLLINYHIMYMLLILTAHSHDEEQANHGN